MHYVSASNSFKYVRSSSNECLTAGFQERTACDRRVVVIVRERN